jgi:hypothetical protein
MRLVPPTVFDLLDDPAYRAYMRTQPEPHFALTYGHPWKLWLRTDDDRWKTGEFPTYTAAFNTMVRACRREDTADVILVSKRLFFAPPGVWTPYRVKVPARGSTPARIEERERYELTFHWDAGLTWCGRCRRPTVFRKLYPDHHVMRSLPVVSPDSVPRCMLCGVTEYMNPDVDKMVHPS